MYSPIRNTLLRTLCCSVIASPLVLRAQSDQHDEQMVQGSRIRFTMADMQSPAKSSARSLVLRGTVAQLRADSVAVQVGGSTALMTMSRAAMGDLAVSRGVEPGWKAHPWFVAYSAVAVGVTGALLVQSNRLYRQDPRSASSVSLMTLSLGMESAGLIHAAFRRVEMWERVRMQQ